MALSYPAISAIVDLAAADPRSAVARADALDDSASVAEQIGARWGAGIALRTLGDADESIEAICLARELALAAGDDVLAADIDVTIAGSLAVAGDIEEGYLLVRSAGERLPEGLKPHAWIQEATFAARQGDLDGAFELFEKSESRLARHHDSRWLGRLYNNRGLICVYVGRTDQAVQDLDRAIGAFTDLGFEFARAEASHNLGFAHVHRGDLALGLQMYEDASETFRRLECPFNELMIDHTEALIAAGMYDRAGAMAAELAATVGDATMALDRAETFFLYARASYLSGNWAASISAAETAAAAFESVGALGWLARTRLVEMRALEELGGDIQVDSVVRTAEAAIAGGQAIAGWHGFLLAARSAGSEGSVDDALELVARVTQASSDAGVTPIELDLDVAITEIRLALVQGQADVALRIARRSIDTVGTAASTVVYSGQSAALATQRLERLERVGTDLAAAVDPHELVSWTDRVRDVGSYHPRLSHPVDPEQASLLEGLRAVDGDYQNLLSVEFATERSEALKALASYSEVHIRERADRRSGRRIVISPGTTRLYASLVAAGSVDGVGRSPTDDIVSAADRIRLGLGSGEVEIEPGDVAVVRSLVGGVADLTGLAVTMSPPSMLTSFPWTLVPPLTDSALAIELPGGSRARRECLEAGPVSAVAAPGMATANDEVDRIASVVSDGHTITSSAVTRSAVLAALQESAVFHFAGHSVFRIDNPGLSYFDLGSDRLHAWELEALSRVPCTVVLASCDSGGAASAGLGVAGFVSTLIALGVRQVVASVVPVPDSEDISDMMVALHGALSEGLSAAGALRQVRATTHRLIAHSFQAFV